MDRIAKMSVEERAELFGEVADELNMLDIVIEKDFWVCWMLDKLFNHPNIKNNIVFKGGTSLSKVYNLIKRFSEDIDLILNWRVLGYEKVKDDPMIKRGSKTQQDKFNKQIKEDTVEYIQNILLKEIEDIIEQFDGVSAMINPTEPDNILMKYKSNLTSKGYIKSDQIKLEFKALAYWEPSDTHVVKPYIIDVLPHYAPMECNVLVSSAERTFWEKATILHSEAHRKTAIPQRYSRHYYDLYQISLNGEVKKKAFADSDLLRIALEMKTKFYYTKWSNYENAKIGSFKLIPPEHNLQHLKKDYDAMGQMIFGNTPSFEDILKHLKILEDDINNLSW